MLPMFTSSEKGNFISKLSPSTPLPHPQSHTDKLARYRTLIKNLLTQYAELVNRQPVPGLETKVVFDKKRDHYMLLNVGWSPQGRVRGPIVYVRLRNGKFWVEEDWLEDGIATDLLKADVPKEDIVLAFHHPDTRPHGEFAVA